MGTKDDEYDYLFKGRYNKPVGTRKKRYTQEVNVDQKINYDGIQTIRWFYLQLLSCTGVDGFSLFTICLRTACTVDH